MPKRLRSQATLHQEYRGRVVLVCAGFLCAFLGIGWRLGYLQVIRAPSLKQQIVEQTTNPYRVPPHRGEILDRSGVVLATSAVLDSIYLDRRDFDKKEFSITRVMAKALGVSRQELVAELDRAAHRKPAPRIPTPVLSKISPERAQAILAQTASVNPDHGAISVKSESKRLYPKGSLAAHLLGYCLLDAAQDENIGAAGLEQAYDKDLRGTEQVVRLRVNRWGQAIEPVDEETLLASRGNSLELTLDAQIQHFAEAALAARVEELSALGGACVAMNPKTGEILAMASYPTFVPEDPKTRLDNARRNRAALDVLEPGSVMKVFTYATAVEGNLISPTELVNCEDGSHVFREGRTERGIKDFHPIGVVSYAEAFAQSSNIAAVKVGLLIPSSLFHEQLDKLGLAGKAGLHLPGECGGRLAEGPNWSFLTRTSVPFGYEISANSVQLLACASAIANGGIKMAPWLTRRIVSPTGETVEPFAPRGLGRMFSEHTCQIMTELMEGVVEHGTGKEAAVEGYRVAGKTGTAKKHGGEDRRYVASFLGFLPVSDPQLAIFCWIDEPSVASDEYTGGRAACPVFRAVAEQAVRLMGIRPDAVSIPRAAVVARIRPPAEAPPTPQSDPALKTRGVMPNLIGMTMREVQESLRALREASPDTKIDPRFYGSGTVVRQDPAPETQLAGQQKCSVHFQPRVSESSAAASSEASTDSG